ncbi:MAG: replication initiation factor domain-containing protein [Carnobacterium sp.]|nr:replication initiation factor domain-containing protein [Carnobacterium sp.]
MEPTRTEIGIDEFTLVLQATSESFKNGLNIDTWGMIAEEIIEEFSKKSLMETIFGEKLPLKSKPQGYNTGYTFGNHPFYFALAYHADYPKMGVVCKFSAYAWAEFCRLFQQKYDLEIYIHDFLKKVQSENYTSRLSRIDLFADYFNSGLEVNTIYKELTAEPKKLVIRDYRGWSNFSKMSAIENDKVVSTFYVGSKRANVNTLLRVYDKKLEQNQTYGFRLNEAKKCNDWVRFEVVYKGNYAHQMTNLLLNSIETPDDYQSLIANKILEKFTFYDSDTEQLTFYSNELTKVVNNEFSALKSSPSRDNNLMRSIDYLTNSSGLNPTIYKINNIWGEHAVLLFFNYLYKYYSSIYEPNDDTKVWIEKRKKNLSDVSFFDYLNKEDE